MWLKRLLRLSNRDIAAQSSGGAGSDIGGPSPNVLGLGNTPYDALHSDENGRHQQREEKRKQRQRKRKRKKRHDLH